MAYPDDKETWDRADTNDIIPKEATNNWEIFLEALQDTLGLGIKMGFVTMKAFFDDVVSKLGLALYKAGGTMTGLLDMDEEQLRFKNFKLQYKFYSGYPYVVGGDSTEWTSYLSEGGIYIASNAGTDGLGTWEPYISFNTDGALSLKTKNDKHFRVNTPLFRGDADDATDLGELTKSFKQGFFSRDVEIKNSAYGFVTRSATKKWRITVTDAGVLGTTEI